MVRGGLSIDYGRARRLIAAAVIVVAAIVPAAAASGAGQANPAASPASVDPLGAGLERIVPPKPEETEIEPGQSRRRVHVKFDQGTSVRVRGGEFVTLADDDLSGVHEVLSRYPDVVIERTFDSASPAALERRIDRIEDESGREQADLNLWFRLQLPAATDEETLIDDLNGLRIVELAAPEPKVSLPNHAGVTPSFVAQQDYREIAPIGIDADFASGLPGGRGQQVEIIDVERDWQYTHEDLTKANGALIPNGTPTPAASNNHGTAVIGEMIGDNNAFGVTGASDGAALGLVNNINDEDGSDVADAIALATASLVAGDVMILEMQIDGPNGDCDDMSQEGCVPIEDFGPFYDAIVAATSAGIIVMEPAGNGNEDLSDGSIYTQPFPDGKADSGAIMVGAANHPGCTSPVHGRSSFSNFGARVNFHGYGECVVTTGYGDLQADPSADFLYTNTFGGTSSATPIVTSAAAVLSSVAQQNGDADGLTSVEARAALAPGATPQQLAGGALAGNVGPMPDLRDALGAPTANTGGPYNTQEGTTINLDGSGSADIQGPVTYEWDLDNDAAFDDSTAVNPSFVRADNGTFTVRLRVTDSDAQTDIATTTVEVSNVSPTLALDPGQDTLIAEGDTLSAAATFTDPGYDDTYASEITWGDGDSDNPTPTVTTPGPPQDEGETSGTHVYPNPGTYAVSILLEDDDAGSDLVEFDLTVVPRCKGVPATVVGTAGPDNLHGTSGRDVVFAGAGDDRIRTGDHNDLICAGPGDDRTAGRAGDDTIHDGSGDGTMTGGAGHDLLFGSTGNDTMRGGPGVDVLKGSAGVDWFHGGAGTDFCEAAANETVRRCER